MKFIPNETKLGHFCECSKFVSSDEADDICQCGHDVIDHVQQIIDVCGARLD